MYLQHTPAGRTQNVAYLLVLPFLAIWYSSASIAGAVVSWGRSPNQRLTASFLRCCVHGGTYQETNRSVEDCVFIYDLKNKETIHVKHFILSTVMRRITEGIDN